MRSEIQELENALDFEFWCEREGLRFKSTRGASGMQLNFQDCPECDDKRWRTYANAETGRGNCFVCSSTFKGKLDFIKKVTGLDWRDLFGHVRETLKDQGWRPKRVAVAVEHEKAKFPLSIPLPTPDGENLNYLEERGVDNDLAAYFHLRYCEVGSWRFKDEEGRDQEQRFNNRVIIPVYDLDGTFVTFQGRDLSGASQRKYLFPKGLPGTGRYLLNGQNANHATRVVMGEGAFDVIATKKALDEDPALRDVTPIGSFGKHLSYGSSDGNDQLTRFLKLKECGLREVTIMWDGEPKALIAALDAAKLLRRIGLKARIALLPAGKDPNEVLPEVVREAFHKATVYTPSIDVTWRLRNPYSPTAKPVIFDCLSA